MTCGPETHTVTVTQSLAAVPAAEWDACAQPGAPPKEGQAPPDIETFNPFLSHAFLAALEEAGCVGGRTGWSPVHLLLSGRDGALAAACPCYLKSHSMGEYVFDGGWADAYERAGGRYYPKLQVSVPFTPVTGRRLLVRDDSPPDARAVLVAGLKTLQQQLGASSTHVTFVTPAESEALAESGFLTRTDKQFHWIDEGYGTFEGFLDALASRKRKAIRRERRDALAAGITVEWVTGRDITEAHWDAFFAFYMDTGSRKWGRPYLNRRFFSLIGERSWRIASCSSSPAGPAGRSRAPSTSSETRRSTAATGAASRTIRFCISRSATIRRSTSRWRTASLASRRVRRASTSSRAAIGRSRLIRRTTSPIPAFAARSPII